MRDMFDCVVEVADISSLQATDEDRPI
jgi:hypothetical protein